MYKVPVLDSQVPINYAIKYSATLLPIIQSYLRGATISVAVKNRGTVIVEVRKNTPTYRLLKKLSDPAFLQTYLLWDANQQFSYIKKLATYKRYPQEFAFNKLGAKVYDDHNLGVAAQPIDHFYTILHDIFVEQVYDSNVTPPLFDKFDFIAKTRIRVCPYCGAEIIQPSGKTKHQIDHFFPKSKYPFLALSYFNLIPSCDLCNESPNKGQRDPIEQNGKGNSIQHPYLFNDSMVRFNVRLNNMDIFDDNNYAVIVGHKEKALLDGYNLFFDISQRYKARNIEAGSIYRSQYKYKQSKGFYDGMPIDQTWLDTAYENLYNFAPNSNEPWSQLYFKMKIDFFEQLYNTRKPEPYYTDQSSPNTEILE